MYATYCFFYTQFLSNVVCVRLSVGQMQELLAFCQHDLLQAQAVDALFCLHRLIRQRAFRVVPYEAMAST